MDLREEVIIKILGKATLECPELDQLKLRGVLQEVLYDYSVGQQETALALINDIQDKIVMYLATKKLDGRSDKTIYNYKLILVKFSNYMRKNIDEITVMDMRMYLATIAKESNMKNTTLSTVISTFKSFFGWLENEEYIKKNPMKKINQPKTEKRLRKALSEEELEVLRQNCTSLREKALLEFLFASGCRLSEVSNIKVEDINWSERSLKVVGKGNKERQVYFTVKAKLYLRQYLKSRQGESPYLFIGLRKPFGKLGGRAIEKEIAKIADRAGFDKAVFPHLLRHTFATEALNSGVNITAVQRLLGHESVDTTMVYAELNEDSLKQEYKKLA